MLKFAAHHYVTLSIHIAKITTIIHLAPTLEGNRLLESTKDEHLRAALEKNESAHATALDSIKKTVAILREECIELGLDLSVAQIDRITECDSRASKDLLVALFNDLSNRIEDELKAAVFLKLDSVDRLKYLHPLEHWEDVLQRFEPIAFDAEEAGKALALERYTACVFHLMRVTECAVLELQRFLDKPDPKAHFGSVLSKLEHLHTKTKFEDLPERLKPYRQFLIDILPQLHAVKDSWRNKVSHVDGKIVPIDVFTREMALGVYDATLLLMKKLANGLPAPDSPVP